MTYTARLRPARTVRNVAARTSAGPRRDAWAALTIISPNVVLFTVFVIVPTIGGLLLSFCSWDLISSPRWVGLGNYDQLIHDPVALTAIRNTAVYVAMGVIPTVILGLILAVFINVNVKGIGALRTAYFMPAVVSLAASAVLWQWIYSPSTGILNYVLREFGRSPVAWLSNTSTALPALDVIAIWLTLPVSILFYLAALQRISPSVIEAAKLDGAGAVRRLTAIIWPQVFPMTLVVAFVSFLSFTNGSFDLVNIMTQGGPVNATTTLVYYTYVVGFSNLELGYAAALGMVQLGFVVICLGLLIAGRKVVNTRW